MTGNEGGKREIHKKGTHHHKGGEHDGEQPRTIEATEGEKDCAPAAGKENAPYAEELSVQLAENEKERQELYDRLLRTMAEYASWASMA